MSLGRTPLEIDLVSPDGPMIHADVFLPQSAPAGTVLVAHGFLGYKDYGMLPHIARNIAMCGWAAISFNFAHSGMSRDTSAFARPDLFAESTWNRQVEDLVFLQKAIREGSFPGTDSSAPLVLLGHSRGGTSVLLATGRSAIDRGSMPSPDGVVTIAAPADTVRTTDKLRKSFREEGHIVVKSNRTGQELRVNRSYIDEIDDDPDGHDPVRCASLISCPMLLVHGNEDPTIPVSHLDRLAVSAERNQSMRALAISGGDHVMNVSNPMSPGETSPQLEEFLEALAGFLDNLSR